MAQLIRERIENIFRERHVIVWHRTEFGSTGENIRASLFDLEHVPLAQSQQLTSSWVPNRSLGTACDGTRTTKVLGFKDLEA